MHVEQIIQTLVHPDPTSDLPDQRIEAAVLSALTARLTTPLVIVCPDGSVPALPLITRNLNPSRFRFAKTQPPASLRSWTTSFFKRRFRKRRES